MKKLLSILMFLAVSCGLAAPSSSFARDITVERVIKGAMRAINGEKAPRQLQDSEYIGSCYPNVGPSGDPRDMGRAIQGVSVDEIDKILYVTGNGPSGSTEIYAMRWDSRDPQKRTFLARSGWHFQTFAHQGTSVYRPDPQSRPLFFSGGNAAASSSVSDDKDDLLRLRLLDWNYRHPSKINVLRTWTMFDKKQFKRGNININITPDQKQLIARAKRKRDNVDVYRVWDIQSLLSMKGHGVIDATQSYVKTVDSAWGDKRLDGQAMAYDGKYIYMLASDQHLGPHSISVMDDKGRRILETRQSKEGQELYPNPERAEGESIFFVRRHGRYVPVLAVYVQVMHPNRKYCEFYDISGKLDRNRSRGR